MKKLSWALSLLFLIQPILHGMAIPLAVKNSVSGIDRVNVPVQMGIPFPQGKLTAADVAKLTVSDSATGVAVPAGAKATVFWHDGSVRWVRLLFPATTSGTVKSAYVLTDSDKNPDGGMEAMETGNTVTVITGPLKFTVKGDNFNLIDEAWINEESPGVFNDGNKIVSAGNTGGFVMKIGNTLYKSNTVTGTAALYEKTGYHAIVKVTGKIDQFAYTVFLYAYTGKPYIKVVTRFYYDAKDGGSASLKNISDIALFLRTNITGGNVRLSTLSGDTGATLGSTATDSAILQYDTPDHYTVQHNASLLDTGVGMSGTGPAGPTGMGWGHLTNGTLGAGGAIRFMWQMAPKNISILGTGDVELHLYSNKAPALAFYGGAGRTHFTGFSFSKNKTMTREMFYAVTQPLYAAAPPKWLSAQTKVMGNLSPCEPAAFSVTAPALIAQFKNMGTNHGHADRKKVIDGEHSYGFLGFGDLSDPPEACGGRHWSNNYYDFPHCIAQAYMVTGSEANIETGLAHALHQMDMDHSSVTGQSRTGPGWGNWGDYTSCSIGFSGSANHYKCQGMFDWGNILAEPILSETGLKVAAWATNYPGGQIRAVGHSLEALSAAYAYTNDATWKTYLENAFTRYNIDSGTTTITGDQPFQQAYLGEGITWALLEIPDLVKARRALKAWADHWAKTYDLLWYHTFGDFDDLISGFFPGLSGALDRFPEHADLYKPVLADVWSIYSSPTGQGNMGDGRLKTFTQKFKGAPHYFHHVLKPGYDPLTPDYFSAVAPWIKVEKTPRLPRAGASLDVSPNPLYANATIRYSIPQENPVTLSVYNSSGQRVSPLINGMKAAGTHAVEWNGRTGSGGKLPSGVYMLELKTGNERLNKKLVLIR